MTSLECHALPFQVFDLHPSVRGLLLRAVLGVPGRDAALLARHLRHHGHDGRRMRRGDDHVSSRLRRDLQ